MVKQTRKQTRLQVKWYSSIPQRYIAIINKHILENFVEVQKEDLISSKNSGAIATIGNKLVGFLTIESNYINWVFTLPEYRKRGIASAMLEKLLHKKKDETISLNVIKGSSTQGMYESYHFKKTGEYKDLPGGGGVLVRMEEMVLSR